MVHFKVDICIIGAGSGGLSVAAGAAQLGLKTVLLERAEMGGDCLNTGCVPSACWPPQNAHMHRKDDIKGIAPHEPEIDFAAVKDHVFDTSKRLSPMTHRSGLGVLASISFWNRGALQVLIPCRRASISSRHDIL